MKNAVTSKGQVTIPKIWRDKFGLGAGARVTFAANDSGELTLKAERDSESEFRQLLESFRGTATAGLTTEEIMEMSRGEVAPLDKTDETNK
jgi:AbrB family looped-hinge helix DNA binding protein